MFRKAVQRMRLFKDKYCWCKGILSLWPSLSWNLIIWIETLKIVLIYSKKCSCFELIHHNYKYRISKVYLNLLWLNLKLNSWSRFAMNQNFTRERILHQWNKILHGTSWEKPTLNESQNSECISHWFYDHLCPYKIEY